MRNNDNVYLRLELFVDPPETDRDELLKILDDKKREWNQKRNRPDGLTYQFLVENWQTFRDAVDDAAQLRRAAKEARTARLLELDRYIANVAGSTITENQVDAVVKKFRPFFTEATIRARIAVPVGEAPKLELPPPPKPDEDSTLPVVAAQQLRKAAQHVEMLGFQTIYEALGVPRTASIGELCDAADRLTEETRQATNKTATISAKSELGGLAKTFFKSEKDRQGFEKSWAQFQVDEELKELFNARCVDKSVSLELYERSIKEAVERGKTLAEAEWHVYDFYVVKRKCPDPRRAAVSSLANSIQCPECFHLNEKNVNRCNRCGYAIRVRCPKCGAQNVGAAFCEKCGFSFGDAELGRKKLDELKAALAQDDAARALEIYRNSFKFWSYLDEAKEPLDELRDRNARIQFDEAEAQLRAGRPEAAQKIAENLSLDDVETPRIARYKVELEGRFQEARRLESFLEEIESLESQRLYSSALRRLREFKNRVDDDAVRSKRQALERVLAQAQDELRAILDGANVDDKEQALSDLCRRFPDFEAAQTAFATFAPTAPKRVDVSETLDGIAVVWERSESPGEIRYKITRTSRRAATSERSDVYVFPETPETRLLDSTADEFVPYVYSIVAVRGAAESSALTSLPAMRVGQIRDVNVVASNGCVTFRWSVSDAVLGIEVERAQLGGNENARAATNVKANISGFSDPDLTNGVEYEYAVALRYRNVDGTPRLTPKEYFVAVPVETAPEISDLRCRFNAATRRIEATWTRPSKGETVFFVTSAPPKSNVKTPFIFQKGLAALEKEARATALRPAKITESGRKRSAVLPASLVAGVQYVWPVVVLGNGATVGRIAQVAALESVANVRVQRVDYSAFISWDWPNGVDYVYILYNFYERKTPTPGDGLSAKIKLTKAEYDVEQAWKLTLASSNASASVQIFPVVRVDGKKIVGPGKTVFLEKYYVEYFLETPNDLTKARGFFAKIFAKKRRVANEETPPPVRLKIRAYESSGKIPQLIVVKQNGRPPMRRDDGVVIAKIPATDDAETFSDALVPHLQPGAYFRCYLANVEDRARFATLDPPESELKLFGERFDDGDSN